MLSHVVAWNSPRDQAGAFGFVVDAVDGDGGAVPEHLLAALGFEDGMVGRIDVDAADVFAVDGEELSVDERGGGLAQAVEQVLEVLAPQISVTSFGALGEGGVVVLQAVDAAVVGHPRHELVRRIQSESAARVDGCRSVKRTSELSVVVQEHSAAGLTQLGYRKREYVEGIAAG
jgi:hypothetical protein